ncbi:MAG: tryptophan synthase subunit alpha [Oscillospiraceae bacterium]|jgi:tryptophan synthase alpha chain|nr:tryptophan synthase subunit alpha [Oscillospiraceae bacterium]
MSRLSLAFQNGKAFIGFVTGGDPSLEASAEFIAEMARAGADVVEIGVPFSDPIAEGPVIQKANLRALAAGTTPDKLFALVTDVRRRGVTVPLVLLSYVNPLFRYGYDAFLRRCRETGVDGLILPDLPFEEQGEVRGPAQAHGVDIITLIAPTSEDRVRHVAAHAAGFVYVVSSMGVTGVRREIETDLAGLLTLVRAATDIPAAVGFGVHTPAQAAAIARLADGVIVGSAIVALIETHGPAAGPYIYEYVREMKSAVLSAE